MQVDAAPGHAPGTAREDKYASVHAVRACYMHWAHNALHNV
jgi:hypothetical protein